jgi:hypothetical protein
MKIEVELSEIEQLKAELQREKERAKKLENDLNELSEKELKEKAVRLSWRLFDNYMEAVFKHLSFETRIGGSVITRDNLEHYLGKEWYNSPRINFELGATVTEKFKSAFLNIGIIAIDQVEATSDVHELK